MDFGEALDHLRSGEKLQRLDWNAPGQCVQYQGTDVHSKMTRPYLYLTTASGDRVPWVPTQTDVLASDWRVVA